MRTHALGRAPGRVNLIGDHTDYAGGLCLPLAIDQHATVTIRARDDEQINLTSAQADEPWRGHVDALGPGQVDGWAAYVAGTLWALQQTGRTLPGLDLHLDSDVPLGAGLSSSAAIEVATALATVDLLDEPLTDTLRHELIGVCRRAENEVVGAPTGGLDQTASLLCQPGHALLIDFADGDTEQVPLPLQEHGLTLLVADTQVSHSHASGDYAVRRQEVADGDPRRLHHVETENARVRSAVAAIRRTDWTALGDLMTGSHLSLRDYFEVSCPELDTVVNAALAAGALGARLTGGGFGGSAIALVPTENAAQVTQRIDAAFDQAGFDPPRHLQVTP